MTELVHDQAAFRAFEERCFEHRLQFVQRLARRRLCHRHRARRLVQRLVIVERDKQLKLLHAQPRHQHLQRVFHVSRKSDRRLETITIPRSIPDTGLHGICRPVSMGALMTGKTACFESTDKFNVATI
nr:hypothetical protein [Paraburkholderia sp.]